MSYRFKNIIHAVESGFIQNPKPFNYRGFILRCSDISKPPECGYNYALVGKLHDIDDVFTPLMEASKVLYINFAYSVDMWFTGEKNKIGSYGCFSTKWFRLYDVKKAEREFCITVDDFYVKNERARLYEREVDAIHAARVARYKTKIKQRAHKLARKYGAMNLAPEWRARL